MTESYDVAETFAPRDCIQRITMTNGLVLFIPLGAVTWVIVTLVAGNLGAPVPWLFGIVVGAAFMAALHAGRASKLAAEIAGMTLTLDARGITQASPVATRFVSWEDLRGAQMVKPIVGMSTGKVGRAHGARSRTAGVDALGDAAATQELGLVGLGTITLASSAGLMARETYRQNEIRNGVDPATGQPLVALYPQQFDHAWPDERIGAWVAHFRPDVLAEAKALFDHRQLRGGSWDPREIWSEARDSAAAQVQAERRAIAGQDKA